LLPATFERPARTAAPTTPAAALVAIGMNGGMGMVGWLGGGSTNAAPNEGPMRNRTVFQHAGDKSAERPALDHAGG
jgi:hypothetical protein